VSGKHLKRDAAWRLGGFVALGQNGRGSSFNLVVEINGRSLTNGTLTDGGNTSVPACKAEVAE